MGVTFAALTLSDVTVMVLGSVRAQEITPCSFDSRMPFCGTASATTIPEITGGAAAATTNVPVAWDVQAGAVGHLNGIAVGAGCQRVENARVIVTAAVRSVRAVGRADCRAVHAQRPARDRVGIGDRPSNHAQFVRLEDAILWHGLSHHDAGDLRSGRSGDGKRAARGDDDASVIGDVNDIIVGAGGQGAEHAAIIEAVAVGTIRAVNRVDRADRRSQGLPRRWDSWSRRPT